MADFSTLINTNNVRNQSITTAKVKDANVTNAKMATDSVDTSQLVALSVTTAKLAATSVTAAKLNSDTAGAGLALDNSTGLAVQVERGLAIAVDAVGISDSGVITAYIADSAVTTAKINDSAVTTAKINDAAVVTAKLADLNVTTGKLADGAVVTAKITDNSVTAMKLGDVVDEQRAMAQDATSNEIYLNIRSTGSGFLGFDSGNGYKLFIPENSISAAELADGSVDTAALQNNAVTPGKADLGQVWAFTANPTFASYPTTDAQLANKAYVDSVAQGLDAKGSCRAASTADLTLSGEQTVDGISLVAGDRILVKDQTAKAENGIYVVAAGAWARASDMDAPAEFPSAFTFIEEGTAQKDTGWVCTTDAPVVVGTTAIVWVQFSSAGVVLAGAGLNKIGNTLNVVPANGIQINGSNQVDIKLNAANPGLRNDGAGLAGIADGVRAISINAQGFGLDIKANAGLTINANQLGVVIDQNKLAFNGATITLATGDNVKGVDLSNLKSSLLAYIGRSAGAVATPSISDLSVVSAVSGVFADDMANCLVYLNGLLMTKGTDYTTSLAAGSLSITFTDTVSSNDKCVVLYKPATL